MAIEAERGCGFRKVGGIYLVAGAMGAPCDRLPFPLPVCPICGQGVKVGRGYTEINPLALFGTHDDVQMIDAATPVGRSIAGYSETDTVPPGTTVGRVLKDNCRDIIRPCPVCDPTDDPAYILLVGEKFYTPESFTREAATQGISKRVGFIPKGFKVGQTVIYLAHHKACAPPEPEKGKQYTGIFSSFRPQRIEKLIWQSQATPEVLARLEKQGITPVVVPDGDEDHRQTHGNARANRHPRDDEDL
jgi:hypothetical protein